MRAPTDRPPTETLTELDRILESLTVPQLLDVAYTLKKEKSKLGAAKEDIIKGLRQGSNAEQLELAAHRVEALAPFKHVFLFAFRPKNGPEVNFESDAQRFGDPSAYTRLDLTQGELQKQLVLLDRTDKQIYLKLVHPVPVWEFEETAPNEFRRRKLLQRHPELRPMSV